MNIYICDVPFDRDTFKDVPLCKIFKYYEEIENSKSKLDRYEMINSEIDSINREIESIKERMFEFEKEKYRLFGDNSSFLVDNFCNIL